MDTAPTSLLNDELERYLTADIEDVKDGLKWWHEKCTVFPRLSRMARNYLSIPGEYLILHLSSGTETCVP
jgi:hAT family C-terminal dimerisation region